MSNQGGLTVHHNHPLRAPDTKTTPFEPLAPGTVVATPGSWPDVGVVLRYVRTQANLQLTCFSDYYEVHWLRRNGSDQNVVGEYGIPRVSGGTTG